MQSNGGLASFAAAARSPLSLVESGPAGGVAGAVRVGQALGEADLLYLDVGGTTAKCSLIRDGQPVLKPDYKLEWSRLDPGYPVQVPVVDIVEIGAGGGSIAWAIRRRHPRRAAQRRRRARTGLLRAGRHPADRHRCQTADRRARPRAVRRRRMRLDRRLGGAGHAAARDAAGLFGRRTRRVP